MSASAANLVSKRQAMRRIEPGTSTGGLFLGVLVLVALVIAMPSAGKRLRAQGTYRHAVATGFVGCIELTGEFATKRDLRLIV